jgi:hypothetical protein
MARRRAPEPLDARKPKIPSWLYRFVVADWPAQTAVDAQAEAAMAKEQDSAEFAAEIHASTRRSDAIDQYATDHRMSRRELGTFVQSHHPTASPYRVRPPLVRKRN